MYSASLTWKPYSHKNIALIGSSIQVSPSQLEKGRQTARQRKRIKNKLHMPAFCLSPLQRVGGTQGRVSFLLLVCNFVNFGTVTQVPVGTNWKTNVFL